MGDILEGGEFVRQKGSQQLPYNNALPELGLLSSDNQEGFCAYDQGSFLQEWQGVNVR